MILTKKQEEGLSLAVKKYRDGEKYIIISGYAGTGKAQPIDTVIPTPNGFKKLGDIKPNDFVYDRTGKPTKVLSIHPQGKLPVYKVTLSDGRTTECNNEHLWSYYTSKGNLVTKTCQQMLDMGLKNNGRGTYKFKIPVAPAIQYSEKEYLIDPYVIGAFLGDGCCKERQLTISSENSEIPNIIAELINGIPCKNSEKNYSWTFLYPSAKNIQGTYREYEELKFQTQKFFSNFINEICVGAEEKRIPEVYKYGSIQQRLNLLQGLFDTDGSITPAEGRYNVKFTSININLIYDIQEILQSLGYQSNISTDKRTDKYTNNYCYTLNINIPNEEKWKIFRLKRKKNIAEKAKEIYKHRDYSKVAITSIEPLGIEKEMVCIYVDNNEHLYLTNNYIVTHNTTLVKFIIEAFADYGIDPETDVCFSTFTGKAAQVLLKKGNKNVSTLHKLLYESIPKPDGTFFRKKKLSLEYKIIVVDEISMAPKDMMDLLFTHNVFVIGLGDPFQLPSINPDDDNGLLYNPDVFLDEIMRQALDSEIIRLSMAIRHQEPISYENGSEVIVLPKDKLNTGMLKWADQILVGTNAVRMSINNQMRALMGRGNRPEPGDKVICLRNYWDQLATNDDPLVNGTIGFIDNLYETYHKTPRWAGDTTIAVTVANFISDSGADFGTLRMDTQQILTGERCLDKKTIYKLSKNWKTMGLIPMEFTYAYAITCHKAQGSSWPNVLVLEERFPFDKEEHARWLYTAVTRSEERLVLVR